MALTGRLPSCLDERTFFVTGPREIPFTRLANGVIVPGGMSTLGTKDLFICHSSIDKPWVEELGAQIEAEHWNGRPLSVFLDAWDIEPGENIVVKLNEALATCRFLAVVLSPEMITSEWCKAEYATALMNDPTNRRGKLVPLRLRDTHRTSGERLQVPPLLASLGYLDFRDRANFRKEFGRLLAKLKGEPPPRGRTVRAAKRNEAAAVLVPALPEDREEPDTEPEPLLSNLLPVTRMPTLVWSAPTRLQSKAELPKDVRLPPFILRESRIFAFGDLTSKGSPFARWVDRSRTERYATVEWQDDETRWRWFIELLNLCLRDHLRPEVHFDKDHERYWFVPQGPHSVRLKWGAGTQRTIVRAPSKGLKGNWIHHASFLRFETIGTSVFLSINPTYAFTVDGWKPVSSADIPGLASQWGGRERNGAILRSILLWADVVTKGKRSYAIHFGDQCLEFSRLPATVEAPVSIVRDQVQVKALLCFSDAEWSLTNAFGFVTGEDVTPEEFDDVEE